MDTKTLFDVNFDKRLGKGSENEVFEATLTTRTVDTVTGAIEQTCDKVAAKSLIMLLRPDEFGLDSADDVRALFEGRGQLAVLMREVEEHKRLCGGAPPPELVRFRGLQYEQLHGVEVPKWVLQELCEGGTLEQRMASVRGSGRGALLPREAYDVLASVVRCLAYIHEKGDIHRDVKPANILFDKNGGVKVGDFGFLRRTSRGTQSVCGTPTFAAPEVLTGTYDETADIYSLAVLVMVISGVSANRIGEARDRAARGDSSGLEKIVGELAAEFPYLRPVLQAVLCPAAERPSAKELLVKLSLGDARASGSAGSAEELVWCAPPYYACCCDGSDSEDEDGGCQHRGEPASDHDWIFCPCCGDGGQVYHASCFNDSHRPRGMRGHKATARRLPPIMPIQFGDVLDMFVGSEANLVTYVGSCLKITGLAAAGAREAVDIYARKVMWDIAFEEVRSGKASSALYRSPLFQGFLEELTSAETSVSHLKTLVKDGSGTVSLKGVAEPCKNSEACLREAAGARMDMQLAEMGKSLRGQCFSGKLLKSNMAMSALFATAELGYTLYSQWSKGDINWSQFRVEAAQIISGHVVSGVASWAGMSAAVLIVAAVSGGPITMAISGMIGAMAGGAIGQVAGRYAMGKAIELAQTDFSKENAQAVVLAMDALNVYIDDPKDLTLHHVKTAYCPMALQMHPDKVHRKDGEPEKDFETRKAQAHIKMSMLNHHYNVLKAYIEERDTSTVWTRVQANAKHSVTRMWADVKAQKDKKFNRFAVA